MAATDPAVLPGRRERKKTETRQRILAAAAQQMTAGAFESITVEALAEAADISRATFFNYFPEKSAVVRELGAAMAVRFHRLVEQVRAQPGTTPEKLTALFEECAIRLERTPAMSRAILEEAYARHQHAVDRTNRTAEIQADFTSLLEDGVAQGDVRTDFPLPLLTLMVTGAFTEVQFAWMTNATFPLHSHLAEAARFLGESLLPPNPNR